MVAAAAAALLFLAATTMQAAPPLRLECSFTGEDLSAPDQAGPRRIGFTIETRGTRVAAVAVDDPTGIFTSGNIVGSFSTAGGGSYSAMPREENPRWRGRLEEGRLTLTGTRREVSLRADAQGAWSGRLRYELPGAGSMSLVKDGALSCCPAAAAAEGNPR
ncbi:MAG TPA: hypothetical protein VMS43_14435 [Allosphingosinicella sp.]|nr:hypothetical protein [Allosphingosinicella sp.]